MMSSLFPLAPPVALEAIRLVRFWRDAGPDLWFAKDEAFDRRFRDGFMELYQQATAGELDHWTATPLGSLALILLFDQYPRNSFRGTPRMYETDAQARTVAVHAASWGHDLLIRIFMYLPLGHSEDIADQRRALDLARHLGPETVARGQKYLDVIRRFGRFPHRNPILGRASNDDEEEFLMAGGFSG